MKKYFGSFVVTFMFLAAFAGNGAFGQNAIQESAPRKLDAQAARDFKEWKALGDRMIDRSDRKRRMRQAGLAEEVQRKIAAKCQDVPQGCRYDEELNAAIPLPVQARPTLAPQQNVQPSAATPAPEPKPDK